MEDGTNILALIAERKILEAIDQGQLDNLPGAGKPLPEDDLANLPDDLRLAWRILRSSGHGPQSQPAGGARNAEDLLAEATEERRAYRGLTRLKLKLERGRGKGGPPDGQPLEGPDLLNDLDPGYLEKLLERFG
jgi:hypothetical protein